MKHLAIQFNWYDPCDLLTNFYKTLHCRNTFRQNVEKSCAKQNDRLIKMIFCRYNKLMNQHVFTLKFNCTLLICWIWFTLMYSWNWIKSVHFFSLDFPWFVIFSKFFFFSWISLMGFIVELEFSKWNATCYRQAIMHIASIAIRFFPWKIENYSFHVVLTWPFYWES